MSNIKFKLNKSPYEKLQIINEKIKNIKFICMNIDLQIPPPNINNIINISNKIAYKVNLDYRIILSFIKHYVIGFRRYNLRSLKKVIDFTTTPFEKDEYPNLKPYIEIQIQIIDLYKLYINYNTFKAIKKMVLLILYSETMLYTIKVILSM